MLSDTVTSLIKQSEGTCARMNVFVRFPPTGPRKCLKIDGTTRVGSMAELEGEEKVEQRLDLVVPYLAYVSAFIYQIVALFEYSSSVAREEKKKKN